MPPSGTGWKRENWGLNISRLMTCKKGQRLLPAKCEQAGARKLQADNISRLMACRLYDLAVETRLLAQHLPQQSMASISRAVGTA